MATNKERLEANNEKIKAIQESLNGKILSVNKEYIDLAKQIVDGTLEEFDNKKIGATSIRSYGFYNNTNLKGVDFTGATTISTYCCQGCSNLTKLVLDENTTSVKDYAFYQCSKAVGDLYFKTPCSISQYAFQETAIKSLRGKLLSVNSNGFQSCKQLTDVDVEINGSVSGFGSCVNVSNFKLSKESVITSLGNSAFSNLGRDRENPENNVFDLDFTNSTFTSISSGCFGSTKYMTMHFSDVVRSIGTYAFQNTDHLKLYFNKTTAPSLSTNSFNNATNFKIFVPYNAVNAYKTYTNWTTHADYIYGFANKDYFEQGEILPKYSTEGFELTWYSDDELTNQVSSVENPNQYYYCTIGAEQVEVVSFSRIVNIDCGISVVDNYGNQYSKNSAIPVGTELTISMIPKDGYSKYYATVNGADFTSPYTYTTVSGENIEIVAVYWNGVDIPVIPILNLNSWETIKRVVQEGNANKYWTVGETKPLQVGDLTYNVRLSDTQIGRYDYSDNSRKTNAVFEFVELLTDSSKIYLKDFSLGGWADSDLRASLNSTILETLSEDLTSLLEEVVIASADRTSSAYKITTSNNKLFIPCAEELKLSTKYGRTGEGTTWDYYAAANDSLRTKMKLNATSAINWWTRSPYPEGYFDMFSFISSSGAGSYTSGDSSSFGVCPCWAW